MLRLLSFLSIAVALGRVSDCNPASVFRPTSLALTPDPPVVGESVHMTLKFDNPAATITEGTATTSLSLNNFPLDPIVEPLCTNTACPILEGANDRSTTSTWPDVKGLVNVKSVWTSAGNELLCILTQIRVGGNKLRAPANITDPVLFRDDISLKQVALPYTNQGTCPLREYWRGIIENSTRGF
jgi:hypothetical protein